MPSFILRTIDPILWAKVKAKAQSDHLSLRSVVLHLLELYADEALVIKAEARDPPQNG